MPPQQICTSSLDSAGLDARAIDGHVTSNCTAGDCVRRTSSRVTGLAKSQSPCSGAVMAAPWVHPKSRLPWWCLQDLDPEILTCKELLEGDGGQCLRPSCCEFREREVVPLNKVHGAGDTCRLRSQCSELATGRQTWRTSGKLATAASLYAHSAAATLMLTGFKTQAGKDRAHRATAQRNCCKLCTHSATETNSVAGG